MAQTANEELGQGNEGPKKKNSISKKEMKALLGNINGGE